MTNQELINIYNSLNKKEVGALTGVKFAYAVARNIGKIKTELEALEKSFTPTEEFKKFDEARIELAKEHAKKDDKGKPLAIETKDKDGNVISSSFDVEDMGAFTVALDALKEEHKEAVEARETQMKEYVELLNADTTVELYKISINDVPKEISTEQMTSLLSMISED